MYGNESTGETRVYSYGAKPPIEGREMYEREVRAMHDLHNMLVEYELDRRTAAREALRDAFPDLAAVEDRLAEIADEIDELRAAIRKRNKEARSREDDPPEAERIAELKAERRDLHGEHESSDCECCKCQRKRAFRDPALEDRLAEIDADTNDRIKALYAEREIAWADFNAVRADADLRTGRDPRFRPWHYAKRRTRTVAQIVGGADWDDLLDGLPQIRIEPEPLPENAKPNGRRSRRPYYRLHLRLGRDARDRPDTDWVTVRFVRHREIPEDARIKQVWLVRRQVGTSYDWDVQFLLERAAWPQADTQTAAGLCGIDLGWRLISVCPDGHRALGRVDRCVWCAKPNDAVLRVAYLVGEDGHEEELLLPARILRTEHYIDELQSDRDLRFTAIRDRLDDWLSTTSIPDWLREQTETLPQWRSPARLARLVLDWAESDEDDTIYPELERWCRIDKRLCDEIGHLRRNMRRQRREIYRRFAARVRWRYEHAAVEDAAWTQLMRRPPAEATPENINTRRMARLAAPGLLRDMVEDSLRQGSTDRLPSEHTTTTCSICGAGLSEDSDPVQELRTICENGHAIDQDRNAARNLIARAGGTPPEIDVDALDRAGW